MRKIHAIDIENNVILFRKMSDLDRWGFQYEESRQAFPKVYI